LPTNQTGLKKRSMTKEEMIRKILDDNNAFENDDTHLWVNCNWETIVKCMKQYAEQACFTQLQPLQTVWKEVDVKERLPLSRNGTNQSVLVPALTEDECWIFGYF